MGLRDSVSPNESPHGGKKRRQGGAFSSWEAHPGPSWYEYGRDPSTTTLIFLVQRVGNAALDYSVQD